jgi:putative transposase
VFHKREQYASDLTDKQWEILKGMIEPQKRGRPQEIALREIINAILYVVRTGCQWRNMPHDFPKAQSVYYHYRKWCKDGTWQRLNRWVRYEQRRTQRRFAHPSAAIVDSQSVKTTECGGVRGYDGNKKVNGRKRHILVDTQGNLLEVVVHSADMTDAQGARLLISKLPPMLRLRLHNLWADSAYGKEQFLSWLYEYAQIQLELVMPEPAQQGFLVQHRRWVVERTFAWLGRYRRLSKDFEHCTLSCEGLIYAASMHSMLKRFAT